MDAEIVEYKIITVDISKLKPDPDNPNEMTPIQMEQERQSMRRYGFLQPIIIDQNNIIIDGHHRVAIYNEFGKKSIQAYQRPCKDGIERALIRQAMNKIGGEHDINKDIVELEKIMAADPESLQMLLGFDEKALQELKMLSEQPDRETWADYFNQDDTKKTKDMVQITFVLKKPQQVKLLKTLSSIHKNKEKALMHLIYQWHHK